MTPRELLERYLEESRRHGAGAEVQVVASRTQEVVARGERVEVRGEADGVGVALRLDRRGHAGFAFATGSADPRSVVRRALAILERLPPADTLAAAPEVERERTELPPWVPLEETVRRAAELVETNADGDAERELRCSQERRICAFGTSEGVRRADGTTVASVLLRATEPARGGSAGHAELSDHGPELSVLLDRAPERLVSPAVEQARLLAGPSPAPPVPPRRVVLDAPVAAAILELVATSLTADAVAERRSRLADRLGTAVAAPYVTIRDEVLGDVPFRPAMDDEGSRTASRDLLADGILVGFLGDRRFSGRVDGAAPGSGWRHPEWAPPRPHPSNLLLVGGADAPTLDDVDEPTLHVLQTYGLHMANPVTGDFSIGAGAVLVGANGSRGVAELTVAGNAFDALTRIEAVGREIRWVGGGTAHYGAPPLLVSGLSIGS